VKHELLIKFVSIPLLGISSKWLAWGLRMPSILILLIVGLIAGPITGYLNPEAILGDLFSPIISLAVAIILFEGGMNLRFSDLKNIAKVIRNLVTIGALVTWVTIATASYYILNIELSLAILWGAILVVTGPTVITPLIKQLRLKHNIGTVLRWEGIVIDPIGAMLAVLVFETIKVTNVEQALYIEGLIIIKMLIFGGLFGVFGAFLLIKLIKKHWIPDSLQETISLSFVLSLFVVANIFQAESGLLAVTIMGCVLANQKIIQIKHIVTFKENLTVLLLSGLFIILAARLHIDDLLTIIDPRSLLFLVVVVFVARPLSVFISTLKSGLSIKEKLFLACMAPRGIVAAAITSLFAIKLEMMGFVDANRLIPLTFFVIISTVAIYSLLGGIIARLLDMVRPLYHGVLINGVHSWAIEIAKVLVQEKIPVLMADPDRDSILLAKAENIPAVQGSIVSKQVKEQVNKLTIGRLISLAPSDDANLLAVREYANIFDRRSVYYLCPRDKNLISKNNPISRVLFGTGNTYSYISTKFTAGSKIQSFKLTEKFSYKDFKKKYPRAVNLFSITHKGHLLIHAQDKNIIPHIGQTLISLI
jgi:NhaP-type Na+/H+ or K+/H+ antiporter